MLTIYLGRQIALDEIYRYIVEIGDPSVGDHRPYVREAVADGPHPEDAIIQALRRITKDGDDDLWMWDRVRIDVRRVR